MSIDLVKLDRALDRTIEAAFNPTLWKDVIANIAGATGSFGANIIPLSQRNRHLVLYTDSMARAFEDYFDGGWHINEWRLHGLPFLKRYGAVQDHQYTSRDVFENHAYYKFHAKHGIRNGCMIGLHTKPDDQLILTLHRKIEADVRSDEEMGVLLQMKDRLMVSAEIMSRLSESKTSGMSEAFETAGLAAIFFDRFGKVTRATRDAERLLGNELMISGRELRSRKHDETVLIRRRMEAIINEKWLVPDPSAIGVVRIERESGRPLFLRIQRLGGDMPDFFTRSIGVCLVEDTQAGKSGSPDLFQRHFDLTSRQASILSKLCEGLTLREISESIGLSYETVRTHLRSIFVKTETSRQSELIALANRIKPEA